MCVHISGLTAGDRKRQHSEGTERRLWRHSILSGRSKCGSMGMFIAPLGTTLRPHLYSLERVASSVARKTKQKKTVGMYQGEKKKKELGELHLIVSATQNRLDCCAPPQQYHLLLSIYSSL